MRKMRIVFRVDSNETISSGHVVRCLVLASAFKAWGYDIVFATSDTHPALLIESLGFNHVVVGGDWRDLRSDRGQLFDLLKRVEPSLLIVDSYSIDRHFVEEASRIVEVCYLGSKRGYLGPLTAIVNYSVAIDYESYQKNYCEVGTTLLLGPQYAPLRNQFQGLVPIEIKAQVRKILISTGGSDPYFMAPKLARAILAMFGSDDRIAIKVLKGNMSHAENELSALAERDHRIELFASVTDMASLIRSCDLAVSANGTTVYEIAACGVPAITFAMVEEQRISGEGMAKLGAVMYCGCVEDGPMECVTQIVDAVHSCRDNPNCRHELQGRARQMTDGSGAARIVRALDGIMCSRGVSQ